MTDMGKKQAIREGSGGVQQMITLERLRNIAIPIVSNKFQELISNLHSKFLYYKAGSHEKYQQAEELLLSELGLLNWKPKHKLNFVSNFSETEEAKRIDADYFQPKYNAILNQIENYENGFDTVSNQFDQNTSLTLKEKEFYHYIEISDINTSNGEILPSKRGLEDIPANGKRNLVKNDLLVSKVRPYRGAVSFIDFELENLLGSGAFTVLQENPDYKKEVLMIYLRSNCIKELLLRYNCGTSYPVIKDEDILNLKIPLIKQDVQKKIQLKIHLSIKARKQSKQLLEIAKRGVEIAIEENEEIAEKWIKRKIKKLRIKLITKKDEIEKFFKTSKEDFISKKSIKQFIDDNYLNISDETLNSYIKEFKEQKIIYSAGRGWYTTVEKTGSLRTEPVEKIVSLLEKKYPFLKFNCWSTEQIQPYLHHLLGKHLTYVYTSREAISNVTDTLRDSGYSILENPSKNELKESINKLNIDVIIRASIEREPVNNTHTSPIEKVIIDLIYENNMGEMYSELEIAGAIGRVYKTLYVDISQLSEYAARKDVQNFYITINPTM
jgi:biotin operon repressor